MIRRLLFIVALPLIVPVSMAVGTMVGAVGFAVFITLVYEFVTGEKTWATE